MNLEKDNVIGIAGGMGPEAGLTLFRRIMALSGAGSDQEHLSVVLMSFPRHISDRTQFLEGRTRINPGYNVARTIEMLEQAGSKVVGIACNTCHAPEIFHIILEELERINSRVKLVHMPSETCRYIKENHRRVHRVGVMGTNGTYKVGIYERLLRESGYEVITPDALFQDNIIHKMVYDPAIGIKASPSSISPEARSLMKEALTFFRKRGADAIILGCTELSLMPVQEEWIGDMTLIDSVEAMAMALIREATPRPVIQLK